MMPFQLTLPFPPSVNHYWVRQAKGYRISDKGLKFRQSVFWNAHQARIKALIPTMITDPIAVSIAIWQPDKRRRDIDNLGKAVLDSLTHCQVWKDDAQVHDLRMYWVGYCDDGRLRITISPITKEVPHDTSTSKRG